MRDELHKLTKAQLLGELEERGVTSNGYGPVAKQPKLVLCGMIQKLRDDEKAREGGAGSCGKHPRQVEGVCPYCRGIWR